MWKALRKRRALRTYRTKLATKLRQTYGVEKHYTPQQVERVVRNNGYSTDYLCFALCMYCDVVSFDAYHRAAGEACDYNAMREQVAASFGSDTAFDASTWTSPEVSAGGCDTGASVDGGSFDGGSFDGGGGCSSD